MVGMSLYSYSGISQSTHILYIYCHKVAVWQYIQWIASEDTVVLKFKIMKWIIFVFLEKSNTVKYLSLVHSLSVKSPVLWSSTLKLIWNLLVFLWMLQYTFSLKVGFLHTGVPTDCVTTELILFTPHCFYLELICPQNMMLITNGWQNENLICSRSVHAV